jgi:glutamate synthase domain-containing protein 1
MVAGTNGDYMYLSSEESAMRLVSPELDKFWCPRGGEPVVARLKNTTLKPLRF